MTKKLTLSVLLLLMAGLSLQAADYQRVDQIMAAIPSVRSVQEITDYINGQDFTDEEKARAVFDWIAANIAYDTEAFFSGRYGATDAAGTFKSRKSVCQGYSELYLALAQSVGLETVLISGYAKGYGYKPGAKISGSNHAWNAVKIGDRWMLVDSTWGAGHVNGSRFEKSFNPFWFDTPPELFVIHHLPETTSWQLLEKSVTAAEYGKARFVETYYLSVLYQMGFPAAEIVAALKEGPLPNAFFYPDDPIMIIEAPLTGTLNKGTPYRFVFESEKDIKMAWGADGSRLGGYIKRKGNQYVYEVTPTGDILEFYAEVTFKGAKNFWQVLAYKCQ
jgi:hypothetical protein